MMCVFLVGEGCFIPIWLGRWARPAPGFRRINARGNETGDISMRQGAPCLYRGCWCWFLVCVFGILYFGCVSKYRNKYRTESIRASWWDYGRKAAYFVTYGYIRQLSFCANDHFLRNGLNVKYARMLRCSSVS